MTREPLIDLEIPAAPDTVWAHLREPALVRRWFGWEYPGLAQEIDLIFVQEAQADAAARTVAWEHGPQHEDRFELEPAGRGTRLRLHRWVPPEAAGAYDDVAEGWITFAQQLRFALARHPGEERRTHYLSADAALPVARALEAAGGEVWFRSPHQLGVVAPELGDGLIVGVEKPGAATFLTLTAYGGQEALDAAVARWDAWFMERVG